MCAVSPWALQLSTADLLVHSSNAAGLLQAVISSAEAHSDGLESPVCLFGTAVSTVLFIYGRRVDGPLHLTGTRKTMGG